MALLMNNAGRPVSVGDYSLIRPDILDILEKHAAQEDIVPHGDFLENILIGDFYRAILHADDDNKYAIVAIAAWIYNNMPTAAWGSREAVHAWRQQAMEGRGLNVPPDEGDEYAQFVKENPDWHKEDEAEPDLKELDLMDGMEDV